MAISLEELGDNLHSNAVRLVLVEQRIRAARHPHRAAVSQKSIRKRLELEAQWGTVLQEISDTFFESLDIDGAYHAARTGWREAGILKRLVAKAGATGPTGPGTPNIPFLPPSAGEVSAKLATGQSQQAQAMNAVQMYLGMALPTSEAAGQVSLDHMGINKTFSWAHPRNMANDLFKVRGSKVIQNMYGDHLQALTNIIIPATNPASPQTIQQVKASIKEKWPSLQGYQVERIARTETAAVWTATAANAYEANGITQFESTIATGPSIGVESEDPCEECVAAAADVHEITDDIPPWHPNCRCEIVPVLFDGEGTPWLPPDDPWAGADTLPVCGSQDAFAAATRRIRLARMGAVLKATGGCLTPAPAPGGAYGGITFASEPPPTEARIADLRGQVNQWPDYSGSTPTGEIKAAANEIINSGNALKVGVDKNGETVALAGFQDGMLFPGTPQTILVTGIVARDAGSRAVLGQIARDAYAGNKYLAVDTAKVSPQLAKTLDAWGFKATVKPGVVIMDRTALKDTFKIDTTVTAPVHAPVAEPGQSLADLEAKKYGLENKIAGHKKKIKSLEAQGKSTAEFQAKLEQELAAREQVKAQIAEVKMHPPQAEVPLTPVEPQLVAPELPTPPVPPAPEPVYAEASNLDVTLAVEPGQTFDLTRADKIKEDAQAWANKDAQVSVDNVVSFVEEGGGAGAPVGLAEIRAKDGSLEGIYTFAPTAGSNFELRSVVLRNGQSVEDYLAAVKAAGKQAESLGKWLDVDLGGTIVPQVRDELQVWLKGHGFEKQGLHYVHKPGGLAEALKLHEVPLPEMPHVPEPLVQVTYKNPKSGDTVVTAQLTHADASDLQHALADNHIESKILMENGDLVKQPGDVTSIELLKKEHVTLQDNVDLPANVRDIIEQRGLDGWPPEKGPLAEQIFPGTTKDTEQMFYDPAKGEWTAERRQLQQELQDSAFVGKKVAVGKPQALFTAGGGASGKSQLLFEVDGKMLNLEQIKARDDFIVVDPDAIKTMLPEYKQLVGKDIYAAAGVHEESSVIAKRIIAEAESKGYNVVIDTTASGDTFMRKLITADQKGYEVQVSFVSVPKNDAIYRSIYRGQEKGRFVPVKSLEKAHAGASVQLDTYISADFIKAVRVHENSANDGRLIAESHYGKVDYIDKPMYEKVIAKGKKEAPVTSMPTQGGGIILHETPESVAATMQHELYSAENKIAGHRKKIKMLQAKLNAASMHDVPGLQAQIADFKNRLEKDLAQREKLKAQLTSAGHKPVGAKPGAKAPVPKPAAPVAPKTLPAASAPEPAPVVIEPRAPEPAPVVEPERPATLPDDKRVVPGGVTKEKGTTALSKRMKEGYTEHDASGLKKNVMTSLVERARTDPRWSEEGANNVREAYGYSTDAYSQGGEQAVMAQLINNWARTSSDADARAVAIQLAVKEELGLSVDAFAADFWNQADPVMVEKNAAVLQRANALLDGKGFYEGGAFKVAGPSYEVSYRRTLSGGGAYGDPIKENFATREEAQARKVALEGKPSVATQVSDVNYVDIYKVRPPLRDTLKAFVRAQYEETQALLAKDGIEEVTLYRGMRQAPANVKPGLSTWDVTDNPVASWTIRHSTAHGSYFYGGTMLRSSAPAHMIFSTPLTGFGCAREWEVLILNGGENKTWIAQNGILEATPERIAEMQQKVNDLNVNIGHLQAEATRFKEMNEGRGPEYNTSERQRMYEVENELRQAIYSQRDLQRTLDNGGGERWAYSKEADLRQLIAEAVTENPELAGKTIKVPTKPTKRQLRVLTPEEKTLATAKGALGGMKRKITNNNKKLDKAKAAFLLRNSTVSWEEALLLDYNGMASAGVSYDARRWVEHGKQLIRRAQNLAYSLAEQQAEVDRIAAQYGLEKSRYSTEMSTLLKKASRRG